MNDINIHNKSMNENVDKKNLYNIWATFYDTYVEKINYNAPHEISKKIYKNIKYPNYIDIKPNETIRKRILSDSVLNKTNSFNLTINYHLYKNIYYVKMLDFGCGTGLVGYEFLNIVKKYADLEFKKNNFILKYTLDGIDISKNMIAKNNKKKNGYNDLYCINLLDKQLFDSFLKKNNNYDIIICCGVFLEGHLSPTIIESIFSKLLKKNGLIICTIRNTFLEKYKTFIDKLYWSKKFEIIENSQIDYLLNVSATCFVIKIL